MNRGECCKRAARMAALAVPLCLAALSACLPTAYPQQALGPGGVAYKVQQVPFIITDASGVQVVDVVPKINPQGRVVAVSRFANGQFHAARTDARVQIAQDLGTLGGDYSDGFDINLAGQA